ncbi:lonely Cys domain-containing protein, partial [Streptomyces sp. NPDC048279]|uniref:lonely Cys domain-containing protein n=1 Tax=Streptomyces sp. NPDC048279 TaxID=3154714 RepID=UPI00343F2633
MPVREVVGGVADGSGGVGLEVRRFEVGGERFADVTVRVGFTGDDGRVVSGVVPVGVWERVVGGVDEVINAPVWVVGGDRLHVTVVAAGPGVVPDVGVGLAGAGLGRRSAGVVWPVDVEPAVYARRIADLLDLDLGHGLDPGQGAPRDDADTGHAVDDPAAPQRLSVTTSTASTDQPTPSSEDGRPEETASGAGPVPHDLVLTASGAEVVAEDDEPRSGDAPIDVAEARATLPGSEGQVGFAAKLGDGDAEKAVSSRSRTVPGSGRSRFDSATAAPDRSAPADALDPPEPSQGPQADGPPTLFSIAGAEADVLARRVLRLRSDAVVGEGERDELRALIGRAVAEGRADSEAALEAFVLQERFGVLRVARSEAETPDGRVRVLNLAGGSLPGLDLSAVATLDERGTVTSRRTAPWTGGPVYPVFTGKASNARGVSVLTYQGGRIRVSTEVLSELLRYDSWRPADARVVLVSSRAAARPETVRSVADATGTKAWAPSALVGTAESGGGSSYRVLALRREKPTLPTGSWIPGEPGMGSSQRDGRLETVDGFVIPDSAVLAHTLVHSGGQRTVGHASFTHEEFRDREEDYRDVSESTHISVYDSGSRTEAMLRQAPERADGYHAALHANRDGYQLAWASIDAAGKVRIASSTVSGEQYGRFLTRRRSFSHLAPGRPVLLEACGDGLAAAEDKQDGLRHDSHPQQVATTTGRRVHQMRGAKVFLQARNGDLPARLTQAEEDPYHLRGSYTQYWPMPAEEELDRLAQAAGLIVLEEPGERTRDRVRSWVRAIRRDPRLGLEEEGDPRWSDPDTLRSGEGYLRLMVGFGALERMRLADPAFADERSWPLTTPLLADILDRHRRGRGMREQDLLTLLAEAHDWADRPGSTLTEFLATPGPATPTATLPSTPAQGTPTPVGSRSHEPSTPTPQPLASAQTDVAAVLNSGRARPAEFAPEEHLRAVFGPEVTRDPEYRDMRRQAELLEGMRGSDFAFRRRRFDLIALARRVVHHSDDTSVQVTPQDVRDMLRLVSTAARRLRGSDLADLEALLLQEQGAYADSEVTLHTDHGPVPARDWTGRAPSLVNLSVTAVVAADGRSAKRFPNGRTELPSAPWLNAYPCIATGDSSGVAVLGHFVRPEVYARLIQHDPRRPGDTAVVLLTPHAAAPESRLPLLVADYTGAEVWGSDGRIRFAEVPQDAHSATSPVNVPALVDGTAPGDRVPVWVVAYRRGNLTYDGRLREFVPHTAYAVNTHLAEIFGRRVIGDPRYPELERQLTLLEEIWNQDPESSGGTFDLEELARRIVSHTDDTARAVTPGDVGELLSLVTEAVAGDRGIDIADLEAFRLQQQGAYYGSEVQLYTERGVVPARHWSGRRVASLALGFTLTVFPDAAGALTITRNDRGHVVFSPAKWTNPYVCFADGDGYGIAVLGHRVPPAVYARLLQYDPRRPEGADIVLAMPNGAAGNRRLLLRIAVTTGQSVWAADGRVVIASPQPAAQFLPHLAVVDMRDGKGILPRWIPAHPDESYAPEDDVEFIQGINGSKVPDQSLRIHPILDERGMEVLGQSSPDANILSSLSRFALDGADGVTHYAIVDVERKEREDLRFFTDFSSEPKPFPFQPLVFLWDSHGKPGYTLAQLETGVSFGFSGREVGAYIARQPEFRKRKQRYPHGYVWMMPCYQTAREDGVDRLLGGHSQEVADELGLSVIGATGKGYPISFAQRLRTWFIGDNGSGKGFLVKPPRPSPEWLAHQVRNWWGTMLPTVVFDVNADAALPEREEPLSVPQRRVLRWVMALREIFDPEIEKNWPEGFATFMRQARAVEWMRLNEVPGLGRPADPLTWSELRALRRSYASYRPDLRHLSRSSLMQRLLSEAEGRLWSDRYLTISEFIHSGQPVPAYNAGGTGDAPETPFDPVEVLTAALGTEAWADFGAGTGDVDAAVTAVETLDGLRSGQAALAARPLDLRELARQVVPRSTDHVSDDRQLVRDLLTLVEQAQDQGRAGSLDALAAFARETSGEAPAEPDTGSPDSLVWTGPETLSLAGIPLILSEPDGHVDGMAAAFVLALRAHLPSAAFGPEPGPTLVGDVHPSDASGKLLAWAAARTDDASIPDEAWRSYAHETLTTEELARSGVALSPDQATYAALLGDALPVAELTSVQRFAFLASRSEAVRDDAVIVAAADMAAQHLGIQLLLVDGVFAHENDVRHLGAESGPTLVIARYNGRYTAALPDPTPVSEFPPYPARVPGAGDDAPLPQSLTSLSAEGSDRSLPTPSLRELAEDAETGVLTADEDEVDDVPLTDRVVGARAWDKALDSDAHGDPVDLSEYPDSFPATRSQVWAAFLAAGQDLAAVRSEGAASGSPSGDGAPEGETPPGTDPAGVRPDAVPTPADSSDPAPARPDSGSTPLGDRQEPVGASGDRSVSSDTPVPRTDPPPRVSDHDVGPADTVQPHAEQRNGPELAPTYMSAPAGDGPVLQDAGHVSTEPATSGAGAVDPRPSQSVHDPGALHVGESHLETAVVAPDASTPPPPWAPPSLEAAPGHAASPAPPSFSVPVGAGGIAPAGGRPAATAPPPSPASVAEPTPVHAAPLTSWASRYVATKPPHAEELVRDLPGMSPGERAGTLALLKPEYRRWLAKNPELADALLDTLPPHEFADTAARLLVDVPEGAHQPASARQEARAQVARMLQDPDTAARLLKNGAQVAVVPKDIPMTDVQPFRYLRGSNAEGAASGGRGWDDVRGSGGRLTAVTEENLLGGDTTVGHGGHYSDGYSTTTHEFAHTIHRHGLTAEDQAAITRSYENRRGQGDQAHWPDGTASRDQHGRPVENYSSRDEDEYFAQLTNAYLGTNHGSDPFTGQDRNNGADWVRANVPEMVPLLERLYGPDPSAVHSAPSNPVEGVRAENDMYDGFRDFMQRVDGPSQENTPGEARDASGTRVPGGHGQPRDDVGNVDDTHAGLATTGHGPDEIPGPEPRSEQPHDTPHPPPPRSKGKERRTAPRPAVDPVEKQRFERFSDDLKRIAVRPGAEPEQFRETIRAFLGNLPPEHRAAWAAKARRMVDTLPDGQFTDESVNAAHRALDAEGQDRSTLAVPGVDYVSASEVRTGPGQGFVNRDVPAVVVINGEPHVPVHVTVFGDALGSDKLCFKDVGQDEDGVIQIHTGSDDHTEKVLWVGVGQPLRQIKWVDKYRSDGAPAPLVRSFLVPLRVANEISRGAVTEHQSGTNSLDLNVDKHFGSNQFGIRDPKSLELLRQSALPGSLRTYTDGDTVGMPNSWGDVRPTDQLRGKLGVPREGTPSTLLVTDPEAFLKSHVLSMDIDRGLVLHAGKLDERSRDEFLKKLKDLDEHRFVLVADGRVNTDGQPVCVVAPAVTWYVRRYGADALGISKDAQLPLERGGDEYVNAVFVPYLTSGTQDFARQVGHADVLREPGVSGARLVVTPTMNGCAFAVTSHVDPARFTVWHYQSPDSNMSHSVQFRRELWPTDWFGAGEYAGPVPEGKLVEVANLLWYGPNGWQIISQESITSREQKDQVALRQVCSRALVLENGREAEHVARAYQNVARRERNDWDLPQMQRRIRNTVPAGRDIEVLDGLFQRIGRHIDGEIERLGQVAGLDELRLLADTFRVGRADAAEELQAVIAAARATAMSVSMEQARKAANRRIELAEKMVDQFVHRPAKNWIDLLRVEGAPQHPRTIAAVYAAKAREELGSDYSTVNTAIRELEQATLTGPVRVHAAGAVESVRQEIRDEIEQLGTVTSLTELLSLPDTFRNRRNDAMVAFWSMFDAQIPRLPARDKKQAMDARPVLQAVLQGLVRPRVEDWIDGLRQEADALAADSAWQRLSPADQRELERLVAGRLPSEAQGGDRLRLRVQQAYDGLTAPESLRLDRRAELVAEVLDGEERRRQVRQGNRPERAGQQSAERGPVSFGEALDEAREAEPSPADVGRTEIERAFGSQQRVDPAPVRNGRDAPAQAERERRLRDLAAIGRALPEGGGEAVEVLL